MDIQQFNNDVVETLCKRQIVHSDPAIMTGIPVFIGTRVPLQTLFDYIEGEDGWSEFSGDFPHLQIAALQVLETIARVMLRRGEMLNAHST
ncbi:DUF433 domain-containing protein [Chamaesiphon sp.]|uniref:DUF433 domain-containing protein n=1 Tax=Chamaesiphon sp. TaxID=2814140 RepID=UPI0035941811